MKNRVCEGLVRDIRVYLFRSRRYFPSLTMLTFTQRGFHRDKCECYKQGNARLVLMCHEQGYYPGGGSNEENRDGWQQ